MFRRDTFIPWGFWAFFSLVVWGNILPSPAFAGITSKGTEFWLAFPQGASSGSNPATLQLLIASAAANSGQVQIPGLGFSSSFTVAAGSSTAVTLPAGAEAKFSDTVMSLGIHVTATGQISVYGLNAVQYA